MKLLILKLLTHNTQKNTLSKHRGGSMNKSIFENTRVFDGLNIKAELKIIENNFENMDHLYKCRVATCIRLEKQLNDAHLVIRNLINNTNSEIEEHLKYMEKYNLQTL